MSFIWKQPKAVGTMLTPPTPGMPAPIPAEKVLKEKEKKKIRRGAAGRTIATGPLGLLTKAPVERKRLLGE